MSKKRYIQPQMEEMHYDMSDSLLVVSENYDVNEEEVDAENAL